MGIELFRDRLLIRKRELKLSVDSLSFESGYSKTYIARLLRGEKSNPSIQVVESLAMMLEVNPAWLAGWSNQKRLPEGVS